MYRQHNIGSTIVGMVIVAAAVLFGIYVGGYVMLYGGIVQVIDAFQVVPIASGDVAIGILKVLFGFTAGWAVAIFGSVFGLTIATR